MAIYEGQQTQQVLEDGLLLAGQKQYQQAIARFTQVVELDKQNAVAFYHRAHAHAALEQFAAARKDFKRSVRLNDQQPQPLFFLGVLLTREGKFEQALWCFERAAALGHKAAEGQLTQLRKLGKQKKQTAPLGPLPDETPAPADNNSEEEEEPELGPTTSASRQPLPLAEAVQGVLADFATTYCGTDEEVQTELRRGLFGRGRKVAKRQIRWKIIPLTPATGASLRFPHHPLRLDVQCPANNEVLELTVWGNRPASGLLKHQGNELTEVFRQQIPASLPALLAALHQLVSTGLLTVADGLLHYNP